MEFYKKLAAICCLLAVINVYGTNGLLTKWDTVAVTAGDVTVANLVNTAVPLGSAPGSADISFRDGLTSADGTLITLATLVNTATFALDATSLLTFDIAAGTNTGLITVKAGQTVSYSATSTFTMTVTATDSGNSGVLTLTATVNGMPRFSATPLCLYIADATATGTTLYTYTITDPDTTATTVTTTITAGNGGGYFTTPVVSGNLITAQAMAAADENVFSLTIRSVDAGTPPSTAFTTFAVLVTGTGTGTCSGGTVVIGSVMTTMALLLTYFI